MSSEAQRPAMAGKVKARVLDAAEHMFGEFGLNGVSLRQIAVAAGSKNHLAVQYHFGGKEGVARAVLERRLPSLEQQRGRLLAEARDAGRALDLKTLLDAMFRPIAYETDAAGRHSYAAFLLGVHRHEDLFSLRVGRNEIAPLTNHLIDLIRDAAPHVPNLLIRQRLLCASDVYLQCVVALDRPLVVGGWLTDRTEGLAEGLELAHAVVAAPVATLAAHC